ncbi:MAG: DUF4115 domain-containing protein [Anaerolineae bacterium]
MTDLGNLLRAARQKKGVTLTEAAADTRILERQLASFEQGKTLEVPSVYARGMLRKYAEYLDLDANEIVDLYSSQAPPVEHSPAMPYILKEPLYRRGPDWAEILLGAGALLVLVVLALGIWRYSILPLQQAATQVKAPIEAALNGATAVPAQAVALNETPEPALAADATGVLPTRTPVLQPTPVSAVAATPTMLPTLGATPTQQAPTAAPTTPPNEVEVAVEITQPSWLQVTVDGKQLFAGLLQPGQNRSWRGNRSVNVRTGNAGGTIIFINGQQVGPLGNPGMVVEREWQLSQGDIVTLNNGNANNSSSSQQRSSTTPQPTAPAPEPTKQP